MFPNHIDWALSLSDQEIIWSGQSLKAIVDKLYDNIDKTHEIISVIIKKNDSKKGDIVRYKEKDYKITDLNIEYDGEITSYIAKSIMGIRK